MSTRERVITWPDPAAKARWLDMAASLDALSPIVRRIAGDITHAAGHDPERFAFRAHRYCRDEVRYRRDPGGVEEFADAATIITRGFDDCDGKSRTFVALCRASRLPSLRARIVPVFDRSGEHFTHVQAECTWPGAAPPLAGPGGWVLAELTLADVPLGAGSERATRDVAGKLRLA